MGAHIDGHKMHKNSLHAWAKLDAPGRKKLVVAMYYDAKRPPTDCEVMAEMFKQGLIDKEDPNRVRPRVTEAVNPKKAAEVAQLREIGKRKCTVTGSVCRVCWPIDRPLDAHQLVGIKIKIYPT